MTTFEDRCRTAQKALPGAPYRAALTVLHDEMLDELRRLHDENERLKQPRQWQGLTDEEINACDPQEECWNLSEVARAIEAKLREKNSG